jgi:hypothetical protein
LSYGFASFDAGFALALIGSALLVVFIKVETKTPSPLLDFRLFRIRPFAVGNIAQLLNSLAWGAIFVLMAFYLEIGLGYTALEAGLGMLPLDFA